MAAPQENIWEIEDLQNRYKAMNGIELDNDQAEKVLRYERLKASGSSKHHFSDWEELDFEQVTFQEILTSFQFENYIAERTHRLKQIEESFIEHDQQYLPQLNAAADRLVYYKDVFIPSLLKESMMLSAVFNFEKEKIEFLKSAYKKYLTDAKKEMLVQHFRIFKTFQPIGLKLSLLLHEEKCLFPDYPGFKATMDIATKGVADYLLEKLLMFSEGLPAPFALREKMENLKEFNTKNTAKHIGEMNGWHTIRSMHNKTEELMSLVLLHPEKYTC